jgi:outer membrane receptor protein involved in Fe transport
MKRFVLSILLLCAGSDYIVAGTTGKLTGRILDKARNEPIVGVNVLILGTSLGASTDIDGYFTIINIPPGPYVLQASGIGYQTVKVTEVEVSTDKTTTVNVTMVETTVSLDVIEIVATREGVVRDLTSTLVRVNAADIATMPVESIADVLRLQAGMTTDASGGLHARGGRTSEIKYYIDGVSVSNSFGSGQALTDQLSNIQELQVISGTFNAEYGNSMSQIVNIVTKEGSNEKTMYTLKANTGGYVTTHSDQFLHLDHLNPTGQKTIEGSISGPVPFLGGRMSYFISGRFRDEDNWLYGQRYHTIGDTANFTNVDPGLWYAQYTGDSSYVAMNHGRNASMQSKLTFSPFSTVKFTAGLTWNSSQNQRYRHAYRYTPDYGGTVYGDELNYQASLVHTLSLNYFHELKLQYHTIHTQEYARESPFDSAYVTGLKTRSTPSEIFAIGGINPHFVNRHDNNFLVKYEISGQIDRHNFTKVGAELNQHFIEDEQFNVIRTAATGWLLRVESVAANDHNFYNRKPIEAAAYVQDKIEIDDIIVNVGVRFDYFDSKGYVPTDLTDPTNLKKNTDGVLRTFDQAYRKATAKTQLSPRLGLAFPITDNGQIHASYGHFFQMPDIYHLYENPEFEIQSGDFLSYIGNADLEAQRTVMYELGVQQKLTSTMILDATCFYKDIRNLLGVDKLETFDASRYSRYANVDYGNVWGVTLALELLRAGRFSAQFDYTYQVADGNGSNPLQAFYEAQAKTEASKTLIPLDWDLRHVINGTVRIHGDSWTIVSNNQVHTGYPYTPVTTYSLRPNIQMQNQGRLETEYNMDLRFTKTVEIAGTRTNFYVLVNNVFDRQRYDLAAEVPYRLLNAHLSQQKDRFNSVYEYMSDPSRQPEPRLIKLGIEVAL